MYLQFEFRMYSKKFKNLMNKSFKVKNNVFMSPRQSGKT